jgi:D-alanyl-D-alanine dipeptidase
MAIQTSTSTPAIPSGVITTTTPAAPPGPQTALPAAAATPTKELSGASWVARFPTSKDISDLTPDFAAAVNKFIDAIKAAGGSVSVSATYRPKERAYLMHYSAAIAKGTVKAKDVPAMAGVNIEWDHGDDKESVKAAQAMASGYDIVYPPALESRHTAKAAIDMTITGIVGKSIVGADGKSVDIKKESDLYPVGAGYGVHKLLSDPPHWSDDGH